MKSWSFYNSSVLSEGKEYFLYNALSGRLLQLDEPHYRMTEAIRSGGESDGRGDAEFMETLERYGFITDNDDEDRIFLQKREKRDRLCADPSTLMLSICPTLECNFRCTYCYEPRQSDRTVMSQETMSRLVDFIKQHKECNKLSVSWYGGEPTMAFEVVEILTEQFLELYPDYDHAALITNAYLLDCEKAEKLNRLKITNVQVTLDGLASIHDSRRPLKSGAPTYRRILENLDSLMNSSFKGSCTVRVNVDRGNREEFPAIRSELLSRYKKKSLTVYPGRISTTHCAADECFADIGSREWADFIARGYHEYGIVPARGFYPDSSALKTCMAGIDHGYVVAPGGELYKCWEDVGRESMIAGSVYSGKPDGYNGVAQRYRTEGDPFRDEGCKECQVFPICDGGCVKKRIAGRHHAPSGIDFCSPYKEGLEAYLAAYVDIYHKREICNIILGNAVTTLTDKGFRLIDPLSSLSDDEPWRSSVDMLTE